MPPTTIHVRPTGVPDETTPGIETRDLARLFRRSPALAGVTVRVEAGRAVAVLGIQRGGQDDPPAHPGHGPAPSYGTALVDGIDVAQRPGGDPSAGRAAPHATGLYDDLTAAENLDVRGRPAADPGPDRAGRIAAALDRVELAAARDDRVGRFSAGMRRRLALGRILLGHPRLVLLDEPYAALDAEGLTLVDDLLDEWRANGATVLVATHAAERLARGSTAGCASSTGSWSRSAERASMGGP